MLSIWTRAWLKVYKKWFATKGRKQSPTLVRTQIRFQLSNHAVSQHLRSRRLIIADKKPAATSERRWPKLSEEAISRVLKDVRAWQQEEAERLRLIEAKKNLATAKTSCTVH